MCNGSRQRTTGIGTVEHIMLVQYKIIRTVLFLLRPPIARLLALSIDGTICVRRRDWLPWAAHCELTGRGGLEHQTRKHPSKICCRVP